MALKGYLIPPSSHFLKSLINFCLEKLPFESPSVSRYFIVFPTKRASLFFKFYLAEKLPKRILFFPRVLSWEDFLLELYAFSSEVPYLLLPDTAKILLMLSVLKDLGISWNQPDKLLFWSAKFLEVFEEFEKEGRIPENLNYPPENLPEQAKSFFEKLARAYELFALKKEEKKFLFPSDLLSTVLRDHKFLDIFSSSVEGLFFAGFVALRRAELEIINLLTSKLKNQGIEPIFFFEDNLPPHRLIEKTAREIGCELSLLDRKYFEKLGNDSSLEIHSFPDPESELAYLRSLLSEINFHRPDDLAIVLPDSTLLQALIRRLSDIPTEVNITLPLKAKFLPLNNFLKQILRAQRERQEKRYALSSILKVISNPLLKALFPDHSNNLVKLKEAIEKNFKTPERSYVSIGELEEALDLPLKTTLKVIAHPIFLIWENVDSPIKIPEALRCFLEVISPLTEGDDFLSILNRLYLRELSQRILPLFEEPSLWIDLDYSDQAFLFKFLENLLSELELPIYGDPLAGLQIMGFLESRLLGFKKIIILNVNEGSIPPKPNINPLLTDEMKNFLKLPIYRNDLWDYYFRNLIQAGDSVYLFYLKAEKGSLAEEPSRFLQRLIWEMERSSEDLPKRIFSWQISSPKNLQAIPKDPEEKALILEIFRNWGVSRYLLETYLLCPVRFYFRYILSLEEKNEEFREDLEIGNFLHKFFEILFGSLVEYDVVHFQNLYETKLWQDLFEKLWNEMRPDKFLDPLSAYLSRKIAYTSVERYLGYLSKLEIEGHLLESAVLGTEIQLNSSLTLPADLSSEIGAPSITLTGRIDFLLKRKFPNSEIQHIAFDFKTNPDKTIASQILEKFNNSHPPEDVNSREVLLRVRKLFSSDLKNFQPLFYLYLLWDQIQEISEDKHNRILSPNAGYITPTNFEAPESSLLPSVKKTTRASSKSYISNYRKACDLVKKMEDYIIWIIRHMIFSDAFYFAEEKDCLYCSYRMPCRALRSRERKRYVR